MNSKDGEHTINEEIIQDILDGIRMNPVVPPFQDSALFETIWTTIENETNDSKDKRILHAYKYWAVAATVALLVLSGFAYFFSGKSARDHSPKLVVISNHSKKQQAYLLPDSSLVWLNIGSQLVYPDRFSSESREIAISGEAFFDVRRNERLPFIVRTNNVRIQVLGTRFNVRSYLDEETTGITLESGSVRFTVRDDSGSHGNPFFLSPNQKAEISKTSGKISVEDVNVHIYTDWTTGVIRFKSETLQNIAARLEKQFGVPILIQGESLKNEMYTTTFRYGEDLNRILDVFTNKSSLKYTCKNGVYTIRRK